MHIILLLIVLIILTEISQLMTNNKLKAKNKTKIYIHWYIYFQKLPKTKRFHENYLIEDNKSLCKQN